ncbi:MAG: hypothetical protein ACI9OJ_000790 [Myxococcota bacterium]|jgi:hypothetical protein
MSFDELDELARGNAERTGRGLRFKVRQGQVIECFGQQRWKVGVIGIAPDLTAPHPTAPEFGGLRSLNANRLGKRQSQPKQRDSFVVALDSAFAGLCRNAGRLVGQQDVRLDLVSVLAAGSTRSARAHRAFGQELFVFERCGMGAHETRSIITTSSS